MDDINSTLPESIKETTPSNKEFLEVEKKSVQDVSKEYREQLNEEVLVSKLKETLINKYPDKKEFFEECKIEIMKLGKNYEEHKELYEMI